VRDGNGTYVLGNGSAFGTEVAPSPTSLFALSRAGVVDVVGWVDADAQATAPASRRQNNAFIVRRFLRTGLKGRNKLAHFPFDCADFRNAVGADSVDADSS